MRSSHRGQVGLLLLVVMGVILAVALSVASSVITDVRVSRQEVETGRTFNAAESGVEEALRQIGMGTTNPISTPLPALDDFAEGRVEVNPSNTLDIYIKKGMVAELRNLTGAPGSKITVYWTKTPSNEENPSTCSAAAGSPAALEVIKRTTSGATVRQLYFPSGATCNPESNVAFLRASSGSSDGFRSSQEIDTAGVTNLRMRPIYNGATIRANGPSGSVQIYKIESYAGSDDTRVDLSAERTPNMVGSPFDFAVFAGGTITHD